MKTHQAVHRLRLLWLALALTTTLSGAGALRLLAQEPSGGGLQLERVLGRGGINARSLSPDGAMLAVAGSRGIWMYTIPEARLLWHFEPGWKVPDVAWSPDGTRLASASSSESVESEVQVRDATSGELLLTLEDSGSTRHVNWSPSGDMLVGSGLLRFWNASDGRLTEKPGEHTPRAGEPAFAPDGQGIAGFCAEMKACVWDVPGGALRFSVALEAYGERLAWAPDSARIAFSNQEGALDVRDAHSGEQLFMNPAPDSWSRIDRLAWSPDGERIAAGRSLTEILDGHNGKHYATLPHSQYVAGLAWSRDGERIASASEAGRVRIRDAMSGETLAEANHAGGIADMLWTPDERFLVIHTNVGDIHVQGATDGQEVAMLTGHSGGFYQKSPNYLVWSHDSQHVFAEGRFWNVESGLVNADPDLRDRPPYRWMVFAAPSPDGTRLAVPSREGHVVIRDLRTTNILYQLKDDATANVPVVWSPDGTRLAVVVHTVGSGRERVQAWDIGGEPKKLGEFDGFGRIPQRPVFAWSPGSHYLAVHNLKFRAGEYVVENDAVRIWDAEAGKRLAGFELDSLVSSLAWSPDGCCLAVGARDELSVWEFGAEAEEIQLLWRASLPNEARFAVSLAWSPDGQSIAAGLARPFAAAPVMLFDADHGTQTAYLTGHTDSIVIVTWSPDGRRLASAGSDGVVRIWRAPEDG